MISIKFKGLKKAFAELHEETTVVVNELTDEQSDELLDKLKQATPVDQGHARDSWRLDKEFIDSEQETQIAIVNDAEYIDELNRGTSRQAPARFIERETLKLFEPDGIIVKRSNRS